MLKVTGEPVEIAYVDQGDTGDDPDADAASYGIQLEGVKLPEVRRGFVLLPRRWVVERSYGWRARFRRLAGDYERLSAILKGLHYVAFGILMLHRAASISSSPVEFITRSRLHCTHELERSPRGRSRAFPPPVPGDCSSPHSRRQADPRSGSECHWRPAAPTVPRISLNTDSEDKRPMKTSNLTRRHLGQTVKLLTGLSLIAAIGLITWNGSLGLASPRAGTGPPSTPRPHQPRRFRPHGQIDTSGYSVVFPQVDPWPPSASLEEISASWKDAGSRMNARVEQLLAQSKDLSVDRKVELILTRAQLFNYEGEPAKAYKELERARTLLAGDEILTARWLYIIAYFQGVAALRRGENENCVMCRGESSCILPISPAAVHTNPDGSRLAIKHFTEYLDQFPQDLGVRWLLNLAHMTLGEYPQKVDPAYLVPLDRWLRSEFDIGRFHDIGDRAKVNRLNQSGGAIMEDFDNDGLLDLVVTSLDATQCMAFYHNRGDGTFEDRTESAGVASQLGGLYCVQTDYNNDGRMDIFIPRGAWFPYAIRPSLLRNNGDGTFADVTEEAKLMAPVNSNSASWADYDNDGFLDLFICCERQPNRLYHNQGDGTFEEVAVQAGLKLPGQPFCKGASWLDFDNDRYPDLFLNIMNINGTARLFRNKRDGTFSDVTEEMNIDGPREGFSCWAWDYDNDGWLDLFATSSDRSLTDVIKGLLGEPHQRSSGRLFRNKNGERFEDVTAEAGLDMVFAPMGSNYGDFDSDGYLDIYLGTGEPNLATLIPNRMFKNVAGRRFAEITATSGTGHLQKGHGVACGDWDRDGDTDLFVQMGGAVNGDKYHNVLFENPGQRNHWLTLKLVGKRTNRAAIGARIKVVTAGQTPLTVYRHVSSGSSFGANPLEQTLGLAQADRVALLEISWPTSGTTQVFHDVAVNQAIEVTEFAVNYRRLDWKPVPAPATSSP
jgi:transposase